MPNVGDFLWATPICYLGQTTIDVPDSPAGHRVASLYDHIADVNFKKMEDIQTQFNDKEKKHAARDILDFYGLQGSIIPKIEITNKEYQWALDFLADYKNPVVVINDNSSHTDKNNWCAQQIRPPTELSQAICDYLISNGHTVLQFGVSDGFYGDGRKCFTPLNGAVPILDLSLRDMAACYKVIGKVVTGETAHPHLGLATGCRVIDLLPPFELLGINLYKALYSEDDFVGEKPRIVYFYYNNFNNAEMAEALKFNF